LTNWSIAVTFWSEIAAEMGGSILQLKMWLFNKKNWQGKTYNMTIKKKNP
jgi:hypothetical protein